MGKLKSKQKLKWLIGSLLRYIMDSYWHTLKIIYVYVHTKNIYL